MNKITTLLVLLVLCCSCSKSKEESKEYTPPTIIGDYVYEETIGEDQYIYHSDRYCPNLCNGISPGIRYIEPKYHNSSASFCSKCFNDELHKDLKRKKLYKAPLFPFS